MTEEPTGPLPLPQPEIKGLARAACVLVSLGGLTAGGFATFKTDNEIGTSALLLVGVLAGIVAILQRIPRIKMGDNEIDPGQALMLGGALGADRVADAAAEAALEDKSPGEVAQAAREAATMTDWTVFARKAAMSGSVFDGLAAAFDVPEELRRKQAALKWAQASAAQRAKHVANQADDPEA